MYQEPVRDEEKRDEEASGELLLKIQEVELEPLGSKEILFSKISTRLTEKLPQLYYDRYLPRLYVDSFDRVLVRETNKRGHKVIREYLKKDLIKGEKWTLEQFRVENLMRLGLLHTARDHYGKTLV